MTSLETPLNVKKLPDSFLTSDLEKMVPRELAFSAHTAHRANVKSDRFWERLAIAACDQSTKAAPQYLSHIIFALSERPRAISGAGLSTLLEAFRRASSVAKGPDIGIVCKAIAQARESLGYHDSIDSFDSNHLSHRSPLIDFPAILVDLLATENLKKMDSKTLLISTISAAKIGIKNSQTFRDLAAFILPHIPLMSIEELSGLLRAFSASPETAQPLKSAALENLKSEISSLSPALLPVILESLVRLGWHEDRFIRCAVVQNLNANLHSIDLQLLPGILLWLKKLYLSEGPPLDKVGISVFCRAGKTLLRNSSALTALELFQIGQTFQAFQESRDAEMDYVADKVRQAVCLLMPEKLGTLQMTEKVRLLAFIEESTDETVLELIQNSIVEDWVNIESDAKAVRVATLLDPAFVNGRLMNQPPNSLSLGGEIAIRNLLGLSGSDEILGRADISDLCKACLLGADSFTVAPKLLSAVKSGSFDASTITLIAKVALKLSSSGSEEHSSIAATLIESILATSTSLPLSFLNPALRVVLRAPGVSDRNLQSLILCVADTLGGVSCKTYCRALQVLARYPKVRESSTTAESKILRKAITTVAELSNEDLLGFMRILARLKVAPIVASGISGPVSVMYGRCLSTEKKREIKIFADDLGIEVEEMIWTPELREGSVSE